MQLVFVINQLKKGGAAKMLKYVANILVDIFDSVSIIDMYDDSYFGDDIDERISIIPLGLGKKNRFNRQFFLIPRLRECLSRINPQYVFSFVGHVNVMARIASLHLRNTTVICAERGDPYSENLLWRVALKWSYRKSDYCFFQLERARKMFGSDMINKSWVIPNPVIIKDNIEPFFGERKKTIVSAGRFSPEKNFECLIDAFSVIHKSHPDYKLIIYGDGPMRARYIKQIKKLKLDNSVSLPGYIKNVASVIREDGIFVLSSWFEGIPNSLIEAMSVAIPCVATDCSPGGPAFLLKDGLRGELIPLDNRLAMAEAISRIIDNKVYAAKIGHKSLEILDELSEPKIREMWIRSIEIIKSR